SCAACYHRAMPSPASALAIDAREVAKTFRPGWLRPRETAALRGATLAVPRGAIVGLLGPNGAGKTTFLSILATLLIPDRGTVRVLDRNVVLPAPFGPDRKSTRLNSSHVSISYAVFCLKKKK